MKVSQPAVLLGVAILSLGCGIADADVCSFDAALTYANTLPTACYTSLVSFLALKDTSQSTLTVACSDTCGGAIYRWYLANCQGINAGLLNATLLSDACSQYSNGAYCAQAATNINITLLGGCAQAIVTTRNCSTNNCKTLIQTSLTSLGCCYNSTTTQQTLVNVTATFQSCGATPAVGKCNLPFTSAAVNAAATSVIYLALLLVVTRWV